MEKIVKNIFVSWTSNNKVAIEKYMNAISNITKLSYYLSDYDCIGDFEQWFKDEINNAPFFLVYITKESLDKEFVKKEVEEIIAKYKKYNYKFITFISEVTSKKINQLDKDHHFYKLINECKVSGVFTENKTFDETIKEISEKIEIMTKQYDLLEYSNRLEKDLDRFKLLANTSFQSLSDFFTQRVLIDEFEQQEVDYDNLINKKKVLIRGEAGSGKSLYIQHLASILNKTSNVFILENNEVQEMISSNSSIISYLYKEIKATLLQEDDFKILMKRATNYLMIEGLDEVISNNKIKLLEKINQFTNEYDNFNIIFTSRNNEDINDAFKVKLLPLDEEKIQETAKKYICFYSNNEEKQHNFYLALNDINEEIKNNPLLLSQLAYIYSITNTLPNNKLDLYDEITSLFVKERNEDNIEVNLNDVIKDFIKNNRKILSKCAYKLVINKDNKDYTFLKALSTCLDNEDDANEVYKYLKARSIINIKDEFYHKTFLEYFASSYIFIKDNGFYEEDDIDGLIPTNKLIKLISKEDISDLYEMMLLHVDSKCEEEGIKQSIQVLIKDTTKYFYLLNILKQRNIFAKYLLKPLFKKVVNKEEHPYHELLYYTVKNNLYVELLLLAKETNSQDLNYMYAFIQDIICLYSDINIKDYEDLYLDNINNIKNDGTKRYQNLIDYYVNGNTDVYFYYEDDEYNIYKENDNKLIGHIIINRQNQLQGKVTKKIIGLSIIDHENFHEEFDSYYKKTIKCFILPKGLKSIKNYMFYRCDSLINVIIPEGVTSIGDYVFFNCNSLENIIIPESVTSIGDCSFGYCSSLTSIEIPKRVTSIGNSAFYNCRSLINIKILNSVKNIGSNAFEYCSQLTDVYYKGTINDWCHIYFSNEEANPMIFAKHLYMLDEKNEWYEATKIEIFNAITNIGNYQFYGFDNLTCVSFTKNIVSIGNSAFRGCTGLKSIIIPESVMSIGERAFDSCSGLTSVEISEGVISIGNSAFANCSNLKSIKIPSSIINIGKYVFFNCSSLTSIVIPESVITIENNTFNGCSNLTSIIIPEGVIKIENFAFNNCKSLTNITIPSSVTSIEKYVFNGCDSLTNIFYKGTLKDWLDITFNEFNIDQIIAIEHVYMLDENREWYEVEKKEICSNVKKIYNIYNCQICEFDNLTSIIIPEEVIDIECDAFNGCESLISIVIPSNIVNIGGWAFANCDNLTNVYYKGTIEDWCKIIFEEQRSNPMHMAKHFYMLNDKNEWYEVTKIEIPNTITSIGNYQFYGFDNLTSIEIPSSVINIGDFAFANCTNLINIKIPSSVIKIGNNTFSGCDSLMSITILEGVTTIGDSAFSSCSSLTSIVIPETVTSIGNNTFSGCSNLTSIIIPEGVICLGLGTFANCKNLFTITISSSIVKIGAAVFIYCNSLINVYYKGTLDEWCKISFEERRSNPMYYAKHFYMLDKNDEWYEVTEIEIPNTIKKIGNNQFYGFNNIMNIVISKEIINIGDFAFYGCNSLINIYYKGTIDDWCNISFGYDANPMAYAKHFYMLNENNEWCEKNVIEIPDTIKNIGKYQFYGFGSLEKLSISKNVISIDETSFKECNNIKQLIISENFLDEIENLFTSEIILKKYRNKEYVIKDGMVIFE